MICFLVVHEGCYFLLKALAALSDVLYLRCHRHKRVLFGGVIG
jgi:hypothetical protein